MPEGDAVHRTARRLDRALSGSMLSRTDFRVPALATTDLSGSEVARTVARGKHLLTRMRSPTSDEPAWTLHTHLKMEGSWRLYPPGQRWNRPAHQARVVLETADQQAVGFSLGIVELVPTSQEEEIVGHLGPDLLGPDWDEDEALRRLGGAGSGWNGGDPTRCVGEALLDQRCLAGLGTIFMSETLFLAGVCPLTPVRRVPELRTVVRLAHRLLNFNRNRAVSVTTGNTRRGQEHYVYLRTGQPCRRCGAPIVTALVGAPPRDRRTYWCPECQPEQLRSG